MSPGTRSASVVTGHKIADHLTPAGTGCPWTGTRITAFRNDRLVDGVDLDMRSTAVVRNLFNRLLGQLYQCLQHGARFDEAIAFPAVAEALAA
ncbi:hypothetical protein AB0G98_17075 [Streptomyces sp. NPDC020196]|uniref:hypothetical protein n=1 Tax=Streptomyces sp. NPDC020196 TaxID=3156656 RepID=UPI0034039278